jgi:HicA toxin of bacterial toxin-antitoxin,
MNAKHKRTLAAIFTRPHPAELRWADTEALLGALGAARFEGHASRVRFLLNDVEAVFHRPHPRPETDKGAIARVCQFLEKAGIEP